MIYDHWSSKIERRVCQSKRTAPFDCLPLSHHIAGSEDGAIAKTDRILQTPDNLHAWTDGALMFHTPGAGAYPDVIDMSIAPRTLSLPQRQCANVFAAELEAILLALTQTEDLKALDVSKRLLIVTNSHAAVKHLARPLPAHAQIVERAL